MSPKSPPRKTLWEQALDALDPTRPIAPFDHNYATLARESMPDYENGKAVWWKCYRKVDGGLDLREFNAAEIDMLRALKGRPNCYQLVSQRSTGTPLRHAAGDALAGADSPEHLATTHMGPTVDDWRCWPVHIGNRRYDHVFQTPVNFVRLALAGLTALEEIHSRSLVHADFHPRNQCLAAQIVRSGATPEEDLLEVAIDWSALKLIDFGYSIQRNRAPTTLLPLKGSPRLDALIDSVERAGEAAFAQVAQSERSDQHWQSFADARFHSRFWRWYGGSALDKLRQLDWREDYWQFGKLLQQLAASIARDDLEENVRSVRWALRELPNQLLRWGGEDQKNTPTPERPNSEYRKKLEAALRDLGARAAGEPVRLLRRDLDPNYRPPLRAAGNPRAGTSPPSATPGAKRSAPAGAATGTASTRLRTAVRSLWETRHAKPLLVVGALAVSGVVGFVLRDLPGGTSARRATQPTPPVTVTPAPAAAPPAQPIAPQAAAAPVAPPVAAGDAAAACWRDGAWVSGCGFAAYAGGPTMRVVGGDLRYRMGSPESEKDRAADEGPQHEVAFARRFALAETETTVAQYLACVEEKACDEPEWRQAGSEYHYQTGNKTYYRDRDAHLADRPISGVSWHNAQQYVRWLSGKGQGKYELPSEAMWEYAARGGSPGRWYFGDDESRLAEHAWYSKNAGGKLHAVGTTQRNEHPWGLRDMHGNVWEWVADCWHDNYNGAPGDGRVWEGGDCGRRVLRGGSWNSVAWDARSAFRVRFAPDDRGDDASFRPSRMLP